MADHIVVETVSGKLRGIVQNGVRIFKGIPYGGPVEGAGRFMPPAKPAPWTGMRDALDFGPRAMQPDQPFGISPEVLALLSLNDPQPMSENCLVLNVWTPAAGDGYKRPVMFWCHGGAFTAGSGSSDWYDGANLSRKGDAVVVTVNHRLGVLGYLHLGDLGGDAYAASGNAGMLDLVTALTWVRDNIAGFGGDPANVTIFGESGGGAKVSVLMAMPAAHGLFHKAIIQSGAAIRVSTRERAHALAEAVLKELGVGHNECERLQKVPAERLLAAIASASRAVGRSRWPLLDRYDFGPVVDGSDLPQHPADPGAPPTADDIPLMIGGTREESAFFLADDDAVWNGSLTEVELRERLTAVAGGETDGLLAAYRSAMPQANPADRLIAAATGSNFWIRTILLTERYAARRRAPVYMYSLDWQSPAHGGRLKAHHAMDLPFVFDNTEVADTTAGAPGAQELAARVAVTWIAFARNGIPDNPAIPSWPAYSTEDRATMIFDAACRVAHDPGREMRLLWDGVVTQQS